MSCVISKISFNKYSRRGIRSTTILIEERHGDDFAIVPEETVEAITHQMGRNSALRTTQLEV